MLVPIQLLKDAQGQAAGVSPANAGEVKELTLANLGITESMLEEFVRKNVEILFPEEDALLIVGQQVHNKAGGKCDLVAIDARGSIVLIELKRDAADMLARKEPLEFQAIRYVASYAMISTPQDLIQILFSSYIEKHQSEFEFEELTSSEIAYRKLMEFLQTTKAENSFNSHQRIVLIASSFDPQTRSACAWLAKNGIDLTCIQLSPLQYGDQRFFQIDQIIPPPSLDQYFVELAQPGGAGKQMPGSGAPGSRQSLPKMSKLLEWKCIAKGDEIYIRGREEQRARIYDDSYAVAGESRIKYNDWGKKVTEWSAINIYEWTIHGPTGKTLDELRRVKIAELAAKQAAGASGQETENSL